MRCLLISIGLSKYFLGELVATASYLVNQSTFKIIQLQNSIGKWRGKPADYSKLRIIGCAAYAYEN